MIMSLTCRSALSSLLTWAWNLSLPFGTLTVAVSNCYQNGNNLSTCQQLLTLLLSLNL